MDLHATTVTSLVTLPESAPPKKEKNERDLPEETTIVEKTEEKEGTEWTEWTEKIGEKIGNIMREEEKVPSATIARNLDT